MSLYLFQAQYTPESIKAMVAKPGDREGPARELFETAGMKLQHIWYSAKGGVVCVAEGGAVNSAAVALTVLSSSLAHATVEELLTPRQQVEAMKAAAEVAQKYRPPGQ